MAWRRTWSASFSEAVTAECEAAAKYHADFRGTFTLDGGVDLPRGAGDVQQQKHRDRGEDQDEQRDGKKAGDRPGREPVPGTWFGLGETGRLARIRGSLARGDAASGLQARRFDRIRIRGLGSHALRVPGPGILTPLFNAHRFGRAAYGQVDHVGSMSDG